MEGTWGSGWNEAPDRFWEALGHRNRKTTEHWAKVPPWVLGKYLVLVFTNWRTNECLLKLLSYLYHTSILLLLPEYRRAMAPVHLPLSCYKVSDFCYLRSWVRAGRAPNSLPSQAGSQNYWHSPVGLPLMLCDLGQATFLLWVSLQSLLITGQ